LVEALRICEVTLMELSTDEFDPKQHKAVDVATVDEEQDGKIVRVVRTGWRLNNQVLRPVEVVIGKAGAQGKNDQ
jgi:molecular chaperone GrpE (heat shock protein)